MISDGNVFNSEYVKFHTLILLDLVSKRITENFAYFPESKGK